MCLVLQHLGAMLMSLTQVITKDPMDVLDLGHHLRPRLMSMGCAATQGHIDVGVL